MDLHVCTVADHLHPNLLKLLLSCEKHKIKLEVLGLGLGFPGHGFKYHIVQEFLQSLSDDDILLFVDAFDVLFLADKQVILEKFLEKKTPFVMSAEKNPYPPIYDGIQSPTSFNYINTGTYIGYVGFLKKWLKDMQPNIEECDQIQTVKHYVKGNQRFYHFDSHCDLFLPMIGVFENELTIDSTKNRIFLHETGSTPCIVHANGGWFALWDRIFDQLIARR